MKKFNYNTIYNNYKNNLLNKLRAFGDNEDLALWVANENITISVLNLIDALEQKKFEIEFDKNSFKNINRQFLKKKLFNEGNVIFDSVKNKIIFSRQNKIGKISLPKYVKKKAKNKRENQNKIIGKIQLIKKDYLINLKKFKINSQKVSKINSSSSLIKLEYTDNKCNINLSINPSNNYVIDSNFFVKKKNETLNKFGNLFSNLIIGLPLDEAKDHLLIKIELLLRPEKIKDKRGIILKNSAGEIFIYFQKMINNLYNQYTEITKVKFGINFFDYKIPENWIKCPEKIKISKIKKNLEIFNRDNCKKTPLKLEKIINSNRLFFSLDNSYSNNFDNSFFMKLEKFLISRMKIKFEVYYVNRKDENLLRSL